MEIKFKWLLAALLFVLIDATIYAIYLHPMYEEKSADKFIEETMKAFGPTGDKEAYANQTIWFARADANGNGIFVIRGYLRDGTLIRSSEGWRVYFMMDNLNTTQDHGLIEWLPLEGRINKNNYGNINLSSHLSADPVELVFSFDEKRAYTLERARVIGGGENRTGNVSKFSDVAKELDANYTAGNYQENVMTVVQLKE